MSGDAITDSVLFPAGGLDMTWMGGGACSKARDLPWTAHGKLARAQIDEMRDLCRACPVLSTCVRFVEDAGVTGGFWAGSSRSPKKTRSPRSAIVVEGNQDAA